MEEQLRSIKTFMKMDNTQESVRHTTVDEETSRADAKVGKSNINRGINLSSINRFQPLRFSANNPVSNDDGKDIDLNKEQQDDRRQVPGPRNYNQVVERGSEVLIFSTSITKGIRAWEFNDNLEGNRTASFRRFHGAKAHHVKEYLQVHLKETSPKTTIIQTGGNDLHTSKYNPVPVSDIANEIMESGEICRRHGVKTIYISSVLRGKLGICRRDVRSSMTFYENFARCTTSSSSRTLT